MRKLENLVPSYFGDENYTPGDYFPWQSAWNLNSEAQDIFDELPGDVRKAVGQLLEELPENGTSVDYEIRGPLDGRRKLITGILDSLRTGTDELAQEIMYPIILFGLVEEEHKSTLHKFFDVLQKTNNPNV